MTPERRTQRFRLYLLLGTLAAIAAGFVGGAYFGRWAVKNQAAIRLRAAFTSAFGGRARAEADAAAVEDSSGEWIPKNTLLTRIETSLIYLPHSDGWGGGIQPMDDGRIFYATKDGGFGVIGTDGLTSALPFKVEMNLDALKRHPVFQLKNFNYNWVRVTDISLVPMGANRYDLLVGHHFFDSDGQCMQLRLSHAALTVEGGDISLAEPFRTVLSTNPCITFNHPDYVFAFEGHFSGGRIARLHGDEVLFSTGDHGWVGLRGYPAVSQDNDSTLGKVLLVNVKTNQVSIFAKGVRNPQGLTIDSKGRIWETEHGPRGGDELNLIVKGENYGSPLNTLGTDYGPRPWPLNTEQGRHTVGTSPQFAWVPSIGVSNLIEVTGNEFPLWRGDLLVLSLVGQAVHRLRLEGTHVLYDEPIIFEGDRLRDIIELPSGRVAMLTDQAHVLLMRNSDAHRKAPFLDVRRQQPRTADMSAEERAFAIAGRYAKGAAAPKPLQAPASAASPGEVVFRTNCAGCHSLDSSESVLGPTLKGVVGRRTGSTDFDYSSALAGKRDVWTSRRIVDFAVRSSDLYPGTSMAPVALTPDERRNLETYIESNGR